jgi:hypothetical protein
MQWLATLVIVVLFVLGVVALLTRNRKPPR